MNNAMFFPAQNILPNVLQKQETVHNLNQTQFNTKNNCARQRKLQRRVCIGIFVQAT